MSNEKYEKAPSLRLSPSSRMPDPLSNPFASAQNEVNYITEISLKKIFSPTGPMSCLPGYESRPQQLEMAQAVQALLRSGNERSLAVEAPTGVGKTFAVLVPTLLEARRREMRVLFLTAGIALQEQVTDKDLPRIRELLGLDFEFGLLKGRSHYVCLRKAHGLSSSAGPSLFDAAGGYGGASLPLWLARTETGDLTELGLPQSHPLLADVTAGARSCIGTSCPFRERCFVIRAYRRAQDWDLTVANYNLYFSHILEGSGAFPVKYDWLVCDEAHRLPEAARSASALQVGVEGGMALFGARTIQNFAGLLRSESVEISDMLEHAEKARSELRGLFDVLPSRIPGDGGFPAPDGELLRRGQAVAGELDLLLRTLRAFEDRFMAGDFAASDRAALARGAELMNWADGVRDFKRALLWCLSVEKFPAWAYWADAGNLMSKPVDSSEIVRGVLEREQPDKVILTSATLTLSGKFDFWSRESGIAPDRSLAVASPFDLAHQMEILVLDIGLRVGEPGYDDRMCRVMERLCDENGGRTLVLLSSLRLLKAFAGTMRARKRDYTVLVQKDMPQRQLLRRFLEDETSILIGSVSFREGVDIPGEGLTQVIIDRIPFPHPNDPLVRARDVLEEGKGFVRVTLPMARLFLRQAIGRLIRSSSDQGRVVLLDGRVLSRKNWGILSSLPPCRCRRLSVEGL